MGKITFFLLPDYQMLAVILAQEVLRIANKVANKPLYEWQMASADGQPVTASNGQSLDCKSLLNIGQHHDLFIICAGYHPLTHLTAPLRAQLIQKSQQATITAGIDTGGQILAELGLLDGYQAVIHWQAEAAFLENHRYQSIHLMRDIYHIDRNRMTMAGGTATADAMLHWLSFYHPPAFLKQLTDDLIHGPVRVQDESQTRAHLLQSEAFPISLKDAIALMEANIETPLQLGEIAEKCALHPKQMARIWTQFLGCSPHHFYQKIRLRKAAALLQNSDMSLSQIALICGYETHAGFHKAFLRHYHQTPRAYRFQLWGEQSVIKARSAS